MAISSSFQNKILINTDELASLISQEHERLSIFHASYKTATFDPKQGHIEKRIPSSVFYDFNEFSAKHTNLSYMIPTIEEFGETMRKCDVRKNDIIVVYDRVGMLSSPRAYWMMKLFGMPNVMILNGTFSKWEAEKRAIESGESEGAWKRVGRKKSTHADDFSYSLNQEKLRLHDDVHKITLKN
jgi:thiosulfate/3-mercaptopyruvate sulfurtransferase